MNQPTRVVSVFITTLVLATEKEKRKMRELFMLGIVLPIATLALSGCGGGGGSHDREFFVDAANAERC